jgi:hypothetical protein
LSSTTAASDLLGCVNLNDDLVHILKEPVDHGFVRFIQTLEVGGKLAVDLGISKGTPTTDDVHSLDHRVHVKWLWLSILPRLSPWDWWGWWHCSRGICCLSWWNRGWWNSGSTWSWWDGGLLLEHPLCFKEVSGEQSLPCFFFKFQLIHGLPLLVASWTHPKAINSVVAVALTVFLVWSLLSLTRDNNSLLGLLVLQGGLKELGEVQWCIKWVVIVLAHGVPLS